MCVSVCVCVCVSVCVCYICVNWDGVYNPSVCKILKIAYITLSYIEYQMLLCLFAKWIHNIFRFVD